MEKLLGVYGGIKNDIEMRNILVRRPPFEADESQGQRVKKVVRSTSKVS